ncbi:kinesin family protein-like protein [Pseudovirgaria hyperparasitica]|uniref:Kinesin family protein-like protein n=1 Tax=Pseudovirgaria hyperparasitica TaxID=470096 RepID=A0A6A6WJV7_9PEZI|nr:kinesin family protein-like protein [Pseudovirgaria hyperparasitica]KAF2761781.1 kinesin family protein-like protein [Pseudovirgaria hyperparasitica]
MASPPGSPASGGGGVSRPMSAMIRPNRSSSRMSVSSRPGGSRASDEDAKTAVKVAVRVRPPLKPDDPGYELIPQRFRGSTCQATTPTSLAVESAQGKKLFVFDQVFNENTGQEGIWDYFSDSVNSFIQGYNVSILAYGQSGAGKSYTMGTTGSTEQGDQTSMGVIPRAAVALFQNLAGGAAAHSKTASASGIRAPSRYSTQQPLSSLANKEKNWQMKASYVEIYNEHLRDLLLPDTVPHNERAQVTIREDAKGHILLTGLHQENVNSVEDLINALNFGSSIRQTDSTAVNAKSSRSHAVFTLNLVQKRAQTTPAQEKRRSVPLEMMSGSDNWVTVDSKLHFVDLAGSERLKNTGAHGERAREGISINAGLASLGKVISQLSSRAAGSHVSYRDSKLTRLLQDSLGGNAITYMVACINPAEFHLSETLNTVQYAQRARAIQSKPQIQQVNEDGDKQAVIDRLRAEVSFLRDQIRLSEKTERRNNAPQERAERQHEREKDMQNQLLDIQENYNALSQRHAKLISEISKARDDSEDTPMLKDAIGDSALERLKRSNSFAEAVESVVLEYEKTIQSLESSLSTTRSSLSSSESSLLERETKIAYMETVQQQLHARIQKALDREASSEQYLRDLEARVDGITSGEEKSSAIIQELRKELTRTKENESSCEEYISTLEERLAESEQDHEMMQREIDRLEHVVERQRSIGKLDNLLYELDHIRQNDPKMDNGLPVNGHAEESEVDKDTHINGVKSHEEEDVEKSFDSGLEAQRTLDEEVHEEAEIFSNTRPAQLKTVDELSEPLQSTAQSKFVADKLENVTQELFDLRVEHEGTVNDYDELTRKYQIALNTLAELQDAVEEARVGRRASKSVTSSRPDSFLAHAGMNGLKEEDGQHSSSRTLSAELSSAGESSNLSNVDETTVSDITEEGPTQELENGLGKEEVERQATPVPVGAFPDSTENLSNAKDIALAQEVEELRKLNTEKESHMDELNTQYGLLQDEHKKMLDYVQELKGEVQKAQANGRPSSPAQVIRRKSSQGFNNDRATRSIASLRNMALENFEDNPEVVQNFEINLNAVMTELHIRSERVQTLETELTSVRKEMDGKMQIISGLTRERSSIKASSPLDLSVVASMRDQLVESENQMRVLRDTHAVRERELQTQIETLQASLASKPESLATNDEARDLDTHPDAAHNEQVAALQAEVLEWKSKHLAALESMKTSEAHLNETIQSLEKSLHDSEQLHAAQVAELKATTGADQELSESVMGNTDQHSEMVVALQKNLEEHKQSALESAARVQELEHAHTSILKQVEEDSSARELTSKELETHRSLVSNLERQIDEHKATLSRCQANLDELQISHTAEVSQLNEQLIKAQTDSNERLAAQLAQHEQATAALQSDLTKSHTEHQSANEALQAQLTAAQTQMITLLKGVSAALNEDTDAETLQSQVENLVSTRRDLTAQHTEASESLLTIRAELESVQARALGMESSIDELKGINEELLKEIERVGAEEQKKARLVEELEDQLSSNYDQHQAANNRLSALQTERNVQLEEVVHAKTGIERELEESRVKIAALEAQLGINQRNSVDPQGIERSGSANSNIRKSQSTASSLPSPPPAIPLPPLPGNNTSPMSPTNSQFPPLPSPPTSRHQSKDIAQAQLVEDQEARIRTIEKHLFAEKQLTATLEEALTDLESSSTKVKSEMESWRKKCSSLEEEMGQMRNEREHARHSLQAVEEERSKRMRVEAERAHLEARMAVINSSKKNKKKGTLNCF